MQSRRRYAPRHRWTLACCLAFAGCGMHQGGGGADAQPGGYADAYGYGSGYGAGPEYGYGAGDSSGAATTPQNEAVTGAALRATIDAVGGELAGAPGSPLANVRLQIPAGALSKPTLIEITPTDASMPLPSTAVACGPMFTIKPAGLMLAVPASLTLPVDGELVADNNRLDDEVKVWVLGQQAWSQRLQVDSTSHSVTVELDTLTVVAAGVNPPEPDRVSLFSLRANPKFAECLAQFPDDASRPPQAQVAVVRGEQNDTLFVRARYIRPELAFSLFTVEHSQLDANGAVDRAFRNFGLAIYHSDFDANERGVARTAVRTILLDQGFAFSPGKLEPTSAFHVGFWFNDPDEAAACGFNVDEPTPFNEDHEAGPMAMISLPDADSGLGPLCTNADTSGQTPRCVF